MYIRIINSCIVAALVLTPAFAQETKPDTTAKPAPVKCKNKLHHNKDGKHTTVLDEWVMGESAFPDEQLLKKLEKKK